MIGPTGTVRVMVATKPVDFRKGMEGLAALVREANLASLIRRSTIRRSRSISSSSARRSR